MMFVEGRAKNGIRNIVSGTANKLVLVLLPFFVRTIMVSSLGKEYLGLNSLFTSILNVLNLTELGFGSALVYSMYKPISDNDKTQICALLKLYKNIYRYIGCVLLIIGLILMPMIPQLINGEYPSGVNIYILYLIYLINTSISYFVFAHKKALLIAYQRNDIISNINTVLSSILYVLQIGILLTVKSYYIYVVVFPIFTIVENIYTAVVCSRKFPGIICKGNISEEDKTSIKNHVKGIALQKICSATRNSFDSIVISIYMGLTTIAIYNNYFYILSAVHSILSQIPNAIRASVGNSIASESLAKNYRDFSMMNFIYMWLNGFCSICLFCLYQPFMKLWMGESLSFPMFTVTLFCIYFYELGMADIISLYKDGAGLWWYGRYRVLIEAIANLILNFLLGRIWGVNGILIATIITLLFIGLGYGGYIVFHYYFKESSYLHYIFLQLKYFLITVLAIAIVYSVCYLIPIQGTLGLVLKGTACVGLGNAVLWIMLSRLKEYINAKRFVCGITGDLKEKFLCSLKYKGVDV